MNATAPAAEELPLALVVEDDDSVRQLVSTILQKAGFRVVPAWTRLRARSAWRRRRQHGGFALVVLDNRFPVTEGGLPRACALDLAREWRAEAPVLIHTADAGLAGSARELGVGFAAKPCGPLDLLAAVEDARLLFERRKEAADA